MIMTAQIVFDRNKVRKIDDENGELALIVFGSWNPGQLNLELCVSRKPGEGHFSQIFQSLYDYARRNNFSRMVLNVADSNTHARRIYSHLGFVPKEYFISQTGDRRIQMEKPLFTSP